jgi:hypothetical protein
MIPCLLWQDRRGRGGTPPPTVTPWRPSVGTPVAVGAHDHVQLVAENRQVLSVVYGLRLSVEGHCPAVSRPSPLTNDLNALTFQMAHSSSLGAARVRYSHIRHFQLPYRFMS